MFRKVLCVFPILAVVGFIVSCSGGPTLPRETAGGNGDTELNAGRHHKGIIAFSRETDPDDPSHYGNHDIWVMGPNGGHQIKPNGLNDPYGDDDYPAFSPNGSSLAFSSNRGSGYGNHDIYRYDFKGHVTQLTDEAWQFDSQSPDWGPGFIISSRHNTLVGAPFDVVPVHVINPKGGVIDYVPTGHIANYLACVNRWGSAMAFCARPAGATYFGDIEIYIYYKEANESVQLTFLAEPRPDPDYLVDSLHPAFNSQGSRIVFQTNAWDYNWELAYITLGNVGASDPVRLTENTWDDMMPCFSPDGNWVAYVANGQDDNFEVYKMYIGDDNHISHDPIRLTFSKENEANPDWSPGIGKHADPPHEVH